MDNKKDLTIALVGAGKIAQKAYLPLLRAWPGVRITGIFSRTQEVVDRTCLDWQIDFGTTNLDDLLERRPDVAFVLTSTASHAELTSRILQAGVDVFLEKPATDSSASARLLADQAAAGGQVLMVGFNRRYALLYQKAKELFQDREIVQILVEKHRQTAFHVSLYNNYLDDTIHIIDLLRFFCPDLQPLYTAFSMQHGRVFEATSLMGLPNGGRAIALTCLQAGAWQERVTIHGGKLTVAVSAFRELHVKYGEREEVFGTDRPGKWMSELTERGFSGEIAHFFDCVRSRRTPQTDGYEAARTQELVEALTRLAGEPTEFLPYAEGEI